MACLCIIPMFQWIIHSMIPCIQQITGVFTGHCSNVEPIQRWLIGCDGFLEFWRIFSYYNVNILIYGGFLKWWYPKMDGLEWKTLLNWMIWGYPYFRKQPYNDFVSSFWMSICCLHSVYKNVVYLLYLPKKNRQVWLPTPEVWYVMSPTKNPPKRRLVSKSPCGVLSICFNQGQIPSRWMRIHKISQMPWFTSWMSKVISRPEFGGPFCCGCCLLVHGHFNIVVHWYNTSSTHSPKLGTYDWLLSDSWNSIHSSEPHRLLVDNYTWPPSCVTITMPRFFGALNRRLKTSVNQKSYTPENEHGT